MRTHLQISLKLTNEKLILTDGEALFIFFFLLSSPGKPYREFYLSMPITYFHKLLQTPPQEIIQSEPLS